MSSDENKEQITVTHDLTPIVKSLMELIISALEMTTAMRLALEDAGVLTPELKASAMARAKAFWLPRRQSLERVGTTEDEILQRLLKDFEGTVQ
jgi:hypothetical protein